MSELTQKVDENKSDYIARTTYMERKEHVEVETITKPAADIPSKQISGNQVGNPFSITAYSEQEFLAIIDGADKETHIAVSKNPHITEVVAMKLVGTVYLAHVALWKNASVGEPVREKLREHFSRFPTLYSGIVDV